MRLYYWLIVFFVRAAHWSHAYRLKSLLYRFLFERRYSAVHLPQRPADQLARDVRPQAWRADSWRGLWDSVSYPGKAERVFLRQAWPSADFDCDDFAIWWVSCLAGVQEKYFASVLWAEGWRLQGHAVCLYRSYTGWYCADYGTPAGPYNTPQAALYSVPPPGTRRLAALLSDEHLRPVNAFTFL